ncbi:CRISPR-associated helicase Cas3 [Dissulfuribacter thermophilus]|uniref:CRISPR-associated helicase Cas3 n=1 Tax=Dissulfuribacter thermophilus TaxID=1156395 RepID=A0A1B9F3I5_9BACT|nr:CRISPR-associated helicase/endonuclease Cas3 [Dissulfuribacter thermophilus]OCC14480.1 CRISPR-associated helicase Cas3 [Dissulfuribacter thermophilus]
MQFKYLLAKSCPDPDNPPEQATLLGHTKAVVEAFINLFGTANFPTRLAKRWLEFFRLDKKYYPIFQINSQLACILHDLGKANSGFQQMIEKKKEAQKIRHEQLSATLLLCPEIKEWVENKKHADFNIIISAIACHHLKLEPRNQNLLTGEKGQAFLVFNIYVKQILEIINYLAQKTDLPPVTGLSLPENWDLEKGEYEYKKKLEKVFIKINRKCKKDKIFRRLLLAVKTALIVADSAGSGLRRENKDLFSWLKKAFDENELLTDKTITSKIINPRKKEIEEKTHKPFKWQDFQLLADCLPQRAVLVSACGSGKTMAAWRWIRAQLKRKPSARVMFLYPTRATASEGFRDYVSWAPEGILLHSSARFDLQNMFDNFDERNQTDFELEDRLFALAYWQRRIFSATIHQFLGVMQYSYRSICLLPLLVDSIVVVDEVHSLDNSLFSALKRFLEEFDLPVLCMSATITPSRREKLEECGLKIFPDDPEKLDDLAKKIKIPRYQANLIEDKERAKDIALDALEQGKKVLWVVNTVDRCQQLSQDLNTYTNILCYHSRFKLEDRLKIHQEVVENFKNDKPVLAITTQVCEMSLDLDAHVLITETAPITSLIQRMGRCNRHLKHDCGEIYLYFSQANAPYKEDDLQGVREFVKKINQRKLNQLELEHLLEALTANMIEIEKYNAFLGDGPWAKTRDIAEYNNQFVQAILDSDIERFFDLKNKKQPFDGLIVPVPRNIPVRHSSKIGGFPLIVSADYYHPRFGLAKTPWEIII